MIQCVGSRNDEHPYCSRICCSMAIKNALAIKKKNPDANIYILYRDIRTYGFREKYYRRPVTPESCLSGMTKKSRRRSPGDNGLLVSLDSPDFTTIEIEADMSC